MSTITNEKIYGMRQLEGYLITKEGVSVVPQQNRGWATRAVVSDTTSPGAVLYRTPKGSGIPLEVKVHVNGSPILSASSQALLLVRSHWSGNVLVVPYATANPGLSDIHSFSFPPVVAPPTNYDADPGSHAPSARFVEDEPEIPTEVRPTTNPGQQFSHSITPASLDLTFTNQGETTTVALLAPTINAYLMRNIDLDKRAARIYHAIAEETRTSLNSSPGAHASPLASTRVSYTDGSGLLALMAGQGANGVPHHEVEILFSSPKSADELRALVPNTFEHELTNQNGGSRYNGITAKFSFFEANKVLQAVRNFKSRL